MPQVPIYNQPTVKNQRTPQGYNQVSVNGDMVGENIARANYVLGRMGENISDNIQKQLDQLYKTKIVEVTNKLDTYTQQSLYDKDNGYFYKTGKNAAGQAPVVMQSYDEYSQQLLEESGLKGTYKSMAVNAIASKRNTVFASVNKHDADETKNWQNSVYTEKENNLLNQAILDRNDDTLLAKNLKQGYNAIELQAELQNWDDDTKSLKKTEFASKLHEGVIGSLLSDGSLRAKEYYEAHKSEILPDRHNSILNAINTNDKRYQARSIVEGLIAKDYTLEQAYDEIDKIENIDLQADVRSQYESKMREKDRVQTEQDRAKSQASWDKVISTLQTNPDMAYQAIDVTQSPEAIKAQMSYIEQMRKFGEIKTGHQVYLDLQEKMTYDAEGFKNTDLNPYRPYLSESDFKNFKEAQDKIGSMEYTIIQEDNKAIDAALKEIGGHDKTEKVIYSEVQSLVNEFEKRHGRKINDSELQSIVDSLGYKGEDGIKTYKNIEKGMAEQVGFIKTITNDFAYFEKIHKRQPDSKERSQIIHDRANKIIRQKRDDLQSKIDATYAKPHETKELTYYADSYIPELGKELGTKFTIVQGGRYRPANGRYTSYHSTGEAVDVSMSEHSNLIKEKFFAAQIKNPQVRKIGTSDPYILAKFRGNPKIKDERAFDKQYGTNHVNHAHITLNTNKNRAKNNNVYKVGNYIVRVKG
jgi:hypothetical protein